MNPKLEQLLKVLAKETESRRVEWAEVDDDTYRTQVAGGLIRIARSVIRTKTEEDEWDETPVFQIVVSSPFGKIVEEETVVEGVSAGFTVVDALFRVARRTANAGDFTLDAMLNSFQRPSSSK